MNDLGFVEAVDGLGESIVVAVSDAADGGFDASLGQAFSVLDRDVLGGLKLVATPERRRLRWASKSDGPHRLDGRRCLHRDGHQLRGELNSGDSRCGDRAGNNE